MVYLLFEDDRFRLRGLNKAWFGACFSKGTVRTLFKANKQSAPGCHGAVVYHVISTGSVTPMCVKWGDNNAIQKIIACWLDQS